MSIKPYTFQNFLDGQILLFNKPIGWSSFDVVKKIRTLILKKYNQKKIKIGHAGTLDPLASGLLLICTGKYTKKIIELQKKPKTYTGSFFLGATTASYDLETPIKSTYKIDHINEEKIELARLNFIGEIKQKPPIFSALKKGGERLYKKARRGEKIELKNRLVNIYEFKILSADLPIVDFEITCSKGTYIRSVANDFGEALKSGAYLSKLCRTSIGEYNLNKSYCINSFKQHLNI